MFQQAKIISQSSPKLNLLMICENMALTCISSKVDQSSKWSIKGNSGEDFQNCECKRGVRLKKTCKNSTKHKNRDSLGF